MSTCVSSLTHKREDRLRRKTQLIQLSQGAKNPPLDRVPPPLYGQMFTGSASEVPLRLRSRESVLNRSSTDHQQIRVGSGGGLPLKHRAVQSLHVATANTYILYVITAVTAGAAGAPRDQRQLYLDSSHKLHPHHRVERSPPQSTFHSPHLTTPSVTRTHTPISTGSNKHL